MSSLTHGVSIERLAHFHCGSCCKWWSIGDAPEDRAWYCPWCGRKAQAQLLPVHPWEADNHEPEWRRP